MKQITITAIKKELVYDIENITHQLARHRTQLSSEVKFALQPSDTESYTAIIKRNLDRAYNKVLSSLNTVLTPVLCETADNDLKIDEALDYILSVSVKDEFNEIKTKPAASLFHDFLVNSSIFDWLLISNPVESQIYKQLMDENLSELKSILLDRTGFYTIDPFPQFQEINYNS